MFETRYKYSTLQYPTDAQNVRKRRVIKYFKISKNVLITLRFLTFYASVGY